MKLARMETAFNLRSDDASYDLADGPGVSYGDGVVDCDDKRDDVARLVTSVPAYCRPCSRGASIHEAGECFV